MLKFITGPTGSGKTEKLYSSISQMPLRHILFRWYKSNEDERFMPASSCMNILRKVTSSRVQVVGIDDAHLFPGDVVNLCLTLLSMDKIVVVAGHLQDWKGFPYNNMNIISIMSDKMIKLCAKCEICGNMASKHLEVDNDGEVGLIPACTVCHLKVLQDHKIEYFGELVENYKLEGIENALQESQQEEEESDQEGS